eukprot:SAG11_NODE_91_length_17102_cov_37.671343_14_plen_153_part_00
MYVVSLTEHDQQQPGRYLMSIRHSLIRSATPGSQQKFTCTFVGTGRKVRYTFPHILPVLQPWWDFAGNYCCRKLLLGPCSNTWTIAHGWFCSQIAPVVARRHHLALPSPFSVFRGSVSCARAEDRQSHLRRHPFSVWGWTAQTNLARQSVSC